MLTRGRFRAILRQEHVSENGEWRAWTNQLWDKRPSEQGPTGEGMPQEQYEAGLRMLIRCRKRKGLKGLFENTLAEITNEDMEAVLAADPGLAAALEDAPQGHGEG